MVPFLRASFAARRWSPYLGLAQAVGRGRAGGRGKQAFVGAAAPKASLTSPRTWNAFPYRSTTTYSKQRATDWQRSKYAQNSRSGMVRPAWPEFRSPRRSAVGACYLELFTPLSCGQSQWSASADRSARSYDYASGELWRMPAHAAVRARLSRMDLRDGQIATRHADPQGLFKVSVTVGDRVAVLYRGGWPA